MTSAGGYLDIVNLDTSTIQRHYYNATPTIGTASFILDLQPPTHCSLLNNVNCLANQNLLSLSGDIVTTNQITASWGGWIDVPSGVDSYEIDVHYLEYSNGVLTEGSVVYWNVSSDIGLLINQFTTILPREGPYSFILLIRDTAGNVRHSRRALLYDTNSTVAIDMTTPIIVTSAHSGTGYLWQNRTDSNITVTGIGHFYNTNLRTTNYLAPLGNYSNDIGVEFDQELRTGRFPRQGTTNALGIVELNYQIIVDQVGGNSSDSLTQPITFQYQTSDIAIENLEISISIQDGDSVRIWFEAVDFRFQVAVDSILIHIDSSPPVLDNLSLVWNGVAGQNLHGTGMLTDLSIRFESKDQHSGIYSVEW